MQFLNLLRMQRVVFVLLHPKQRHWSQQTGLPCLHCPHNALPLPFLSGFRQISLHPSLRKSAGAWDENICLRLHGGERFTG